MSALLKILGVGIVGGILSMVLKQYRREFGVLTGLITAVVIFFFTIDELQGIVSDLWTIVEKSGVAPEYFTMIIKITGVAYIVQFAAEILRDSGENASALKVEMAGKIFILALTMPVINDFLEVCINAVNSI